ncbi:MAG: T9SS type A sorting domain-containing protein [bacterium]|nr:T9SS type A sorting domain-containing protein [bacterium]
MRQPRLLRLLLVVLLLLVAWLGSVGAARATVVHADSADFLLDVVTAVDGSDGGLPPATRLAAISPNPFNPVTTISFDLAVPGTATLAIHDLRGRLVRTIVAGSLAAGRHQAAWNGCDERGMAVASGTYVCRLVAGGRSRAMKLVLAK